MQDWHQKQVDTARRRSEQAARARQKMAGRGLAQVGCDRCVLLLASRLTHCVWHNMAGAAWRRWAALHVMCAGALALDGPAAMRQRSACFHTLSCGSALRVSMPFHTSCKLVAMCLHEHLDDDQVLDPEPRVVQI